MDVLPLDFERDAAAEAPRWGVQARECPLLRLQTSDERRHSLPLELLVDPPPLGRERTHSAGRRGLVGVGVRVGVQVGVGV